MRKLLLLLAGAGVAVLTLALSAGAQAPPPTPRADIIPHCITVGNTGDPIEDCGQEETGQSVTDLGSVPGDLADNAAHICHESPVGGGTRRNARAAVDTGVVCAADNGGVTFYVTKTDIVEGQAAAGNMNHKYEHWMIGRTCYAQNFCWISSYLTTSGGTKLGSRTYTGSMTPPDHNVYVGASFPRTAGRPLCQVLSGQGSVAPSGGGAMRVNSSCYYRYG